MKRLLTGILLLLFCAGHASWALEQSQIPAKFPLYWGQNAGTNYIRNIPTSSQIGIQNCAASLNDGWPPLTFVPSSAGGCAPWGQDFNGILRQITQWSQWEGAGGAVFYDSAFSASIGGYPNGAVLRSASVPGCSWVSLVDNNTSDPDTGGANWLDTCAAVANAWSGVGSVLIARNGNSVTVQNAHGKARMWPAANQIQSSTVPLLVEDRYGNSLASICTGTNSACFQEFVNWVVENGQAGEVDCGGTIQVSAQNATINSTTVVTGLSSTSSLAVGDYVAGIGIQPKTTIASIDSSSQIHLSLAATATNTILMTFSIFSTQIVSTVGITFPPVQQGTFEVNNCALAFASNVTGPGLSFDSLEIAYFHWNGGQITYVPSSRQSNSYAIYFNPHNPTPIDGAVFIDTSDIYISNIATNNAVCVMCVDLGEGTVAGSHFTSTELNGSGTALSAFAVFNNNSNGAFDGNGVDLIQVDDFTNSGISLGGAGANPLLIYGNTFHAFISPSVTTGQCINSFGVQNIYTGLCSNGIAGGNIQTAMIFNANASEEQVYMTLVGVTTEVSCASGATMSGVLNGVFYGACSPGVSFTGSPTSSFQSAKGVVIHQ